MPFLMSQLLSKLNLNDNSHFGREMKREGKEETVSNLITWLHIEASVRSRGKNNTVSEDRNQSRHTGPQEKQRTMPQVASYKQLQEIKRLNMQQMQKKPSPFSSQ